MNLVRFSFPLAAPMDFTKYFILHKYLLRLWFQSPPSTRTAVPQLPHCQALSGVGQPTFRSSAVRCSVGTGPSLPVVRAGQSLMHLTRLCQMSGVRQNSGASWSLTSALGASCSPSMCLRPKSFLCPLGIKVQILVILLGFSWLQSPRPACPSRCLPRSSQSLLFNEL